MADTEVNPYLKQAIMTASSEQLHLMLYDGAIRFSTQAREALQRNDIEASYSLLSRAQRIVSEMENGLNHEIDPDLCARMASLYGFVFGRLVDANINRDIAALDDAIKILQMQRETWALLVEKVTKARSAESQTQQQANPGSQTPANPDQESPSINYEG